MLLGRNFFHFNIFYVVFSQVTLVTASFPDYDHSKCHRSELGDFAPRPEMGSLSLNIAQFCEKGGLILPRIAHFRLEHFQQLELFTARYNHKICKLNSVQLHALKWSLRL